MCLGNAEAVWRLPGSHQDSRQKGQVGDCVRKEDDLTQALP